MTAAVPTAFTIEPCSYAEARALAGELEVSEPVAMTLVRRGYRTAAAAREFLEAREAHDPFEFKAMEEVVALLLEAAARGERITVHGDYDVDGVCATSILVAALRDVGAECDWYLPDRLGDGYGLSAETVRRLAARGTRVLVTADCGISCPDEVALARDLGLRVVVTDHHEPGDRLPRALTLHPRLSGYPFAELCAAGVAHKLAAALRERAGADAADPGVAPLGAAIGGASAQDLDLVALATVADLVPLQGENRALVRAGIAEIRRARRPGIRALMAAAGCEPARADEGDLAFRLAPRINAAGRLYRADAGVELMLTADPGRAREIADELDRANRERRSAERDALAGAERALAELPDALREAPAIVVAGRGWHPGVVGIVASRLVERHWRPAIVIGLDGEGGGRGSGRSIPGFDLLGGLRACSEHLGRFGGHRAAAGLELEERRVDAFREAFAAHAAERLAPGDLVRSEPVDAVVGGESLGHGIAGELERLAPFGKGNPEPRLLVPAARVRDVRPMGEQGRHARFSLQSGASRAPGVAFGVNGELDRAAAGGPLDVSVKLELNRWNGTVEPRVVLRELYPPALGPGPLADSNGSGASPAGNGACAAVSGPSAGEPASEPCESAMSAEEWWDRFGAEREADLSAWPAVAPTSADLGRPSDGHRRTVVDRRGGSPVARVAALLSTGAPVLALCAEVSRRRGLAESAAAPARFGGGEAAFACGHCAAQPMRERCAAIAADGRGLALADWEALALAPELALGFEHVVLVDPAPFAHLEALAGLGEGFLHLAWGEAELDLSARVHDAAWPRRPALAAAYRSLREAAEPAAPTTGAGERLLAALSGDGLHRRTPERAARAARVLEELGLVEWSGTGTDRGVRVVSSEGRELERSGAFRAYTARHEEGKRFLSSKRQR